MPPVAINLEQKGGIKHGLLGNNQSSTIQHPRSRANATLAIKQPQ